MRRALALLSDGDVLDRSASHESDRVEEVAAICGRLRRNGGGGPGTCRRSRTSPACGARGEPARQEGNSGGRCVSWPGTAWRRRQRPRGEQIPAVWFPGAYLVRPPRGDCGDGPSRGPGRAAGLRGSTSGVADRLLRLSTSHTLETRGERHVGEHGPQTNTMCMPLRTTCAPMVATRLLPEDPPPTEHRGRGSELTASPTAASPRRATGARARCG